MYQSSDNHHLHSMGSNIPSKQVFMNKQMCEQILNRQLFWLCYKGTLTEVGMAIRRKILFLEESRSRGIAIYHSSGIEEDEIYSSGIRGISRN